MITANFMKSKLPELLILEGVDCTGKTSVADELKGDSQVHFGPPTDCNEPIYNYWLRKINSLAKHPYANLIQKAIWDRSFLGNYIYGNHKGDQPALTLPEVKLLLHEIADRYDVKIYLLRACALDLRHRYAFRGETYVTVPEAIELQEKYEELFRDLRKYCEDARLNITPEVLPKEWSLIKIIDHITTNGY